MSDMREFFMKTAFLLSEESKCVAHHVGAIVVKETRIVALGYNGTPPGEDNCCDVFTPEDYGKEHREWSRKNELHAEMNALMYMARNNISAEGCDMYVTLSPCYDCQKNLRMSGVQNVYYHYEYERHGLNSMMTNELNVEQLRLPAVDQFIKTNGIWTRSKEIKPGGQVRSV